MNKKMTREYAVLSLRAGALAASIDNVLGSTTTQDHVRMLRWALTEEFLEHMKKTAIASGVPADHLENAEAFVRELVSQPGFMDRAMELQRRNDQALTS